MNGASTEASDRPENSSCSDSGEAEEGEAAAGSPCRVDPGSADGLCSPALPGSEPDHSEDSDEPQQVCDPRLEHESA